jgi:tetratricopeptide (TPR) repeat protein
LQEISRRAPDFWSWRKAVLRFTSEASEEPIVPVMRDLNPPERLFDREDNNDYIPPPLEILSEIHQLESKNPTSPNLATLYAKLAEIYAKRIARGEATDLEFEQQQAIDAFEQAIDRYRELNKQSALASTLHKFGNFLLKQSQYEKAIYSYQRSLDISREIDNGYNEAIVLNSLGTAYTSLRQYQLAINFYQQSLILYREMGNRNGEANSLNNLGSTYNSSGQYKLAIEFHQQSLAIKRELGDLNSEASSLNNLGNTYQLLGQYHRAVDFYQQSLDIYRKIGNLHGEAASLNGLGNTCKSLSQYQKAIYFYQQSLDIHRKIGNLHGEAGVLFNQGILLAHIEEYSIVESLKKIKQSRATYVKLKFDSGIDKCDKEIDKLERIIATEQRQSAQAITDPIPKEDWVERSLDHNSAP